MIWARRGWAFGPVAAMTRSVKLGSYCGFSNLYDLALADSRMTAGSTSGMSWPMMDVFIFEG